jgi:hypothetical protein
MSETIEVRTAAAPLLIGQRPRPRRLQIDWRTVHASHILGAGDPLRPNIDPLTVDTIQTVNDGVPVEFRDE